MKSMGIYPQFLAWKKSGVSKSKLVYFEPNIGVFSWNDLAALQFKVVFGLHFLPCGNAGSASWIFPFPFGFEVQLKRQVTFKVIFLKRISHHDYTTNTHTH